MKYQNNTNSSWWIITKLVSQLGRNEPSSLSTEALLVFSCTLRFCFSFNFTVNVTKLSQSSQASAVVTYVDSSVPTIKINPFNGLVNPVSKLTVKGKYSSDSWILGGQQTTWKLAVFNTVKMYNQLPFLAVLFYSVPESILIYQLDLKYGRDGWIQFCPVASYTQSFKFKSSCHYIHFKLNRPGLPLLKLIRKAACLLN